MYKRNIKNHGLWLCMYDNIGEDIKYTTFTELSQDDKEELNLQIDYLIKDQYNFIHYNGLQETILDKLEIKGVIEYGLEKKIGKELLERLSDKEKESKWEEIKESEKEELLKDVNKEDTNPFNNKIIIVDEVHNIISSALSNGKIGPRLYELLMNAKNSKYVLLSGTPAINYPEELSYLFNLLRGPIISYSIKFKTKILDNMMIYKINYWKHS